VPKTIITLLAALLTLIAAPAADARWVTGAGTPPAFQARAVCQNGMVFEYATFLPAGTPPQDKMKLYDLQVFVDDPINLGVKSPRLLAGGTFSVPREPFYIDPETIGGSIATWLPKREGWFDYHAAITLPFRASPDTRVMVRWRRSPEASWSGNWIYTVTDCWL
jgi:hypothetical protein